MAPARPQKSRGNSADFYQRLIAAGTDDALIPVKSAKVAHRGRWIEGISKEAQRAC